MTPLCDLGYSFAKSLFKPSPRLRRAMVLPKPGCRPQLFCALMALGLFLGMAGQAKAQGAFNYATLDFPGSTATLALGINDHGQIVGSYVAAGGTTHGFLLSDGSYTTLDYPGATATEARGINKSGQIVGRYFAGGTYHGFLLSNGLYTTLDVPGSTTTFALGIN